MTDSLLSTMRTAASGLQSQSMRMRVVSENLANIESAGMTPGSEPYRRKLVSFESALDGMTGANVVNVGRIFRDREPFRSEFRPGHPAADTSGYVKMPNVNMIIEMADMREAICDPSGLFCVRLGSKSDFGYLSGTAGPQL